MENKDNDSEVQESPKQKKKGALGVVRGRDFAALMGLFFVFGLGWAAHVAVLREANLVSFRKDEILLKKDLTGCILRKQAAAKIELLIAEGEHLKDDAAKITWLKKVLSFIQTIGLPNDDVNEHGKSMSKVELNIWNAFRKESVRVQAQEVLGVLSGFRAALEVQASDQ